MPPARLSPFHFPFNDDSQPWTSHYLSLRLPVTGPEPLESIVLRIGTFSNSQKPGRLPSTKVFSHTPGHHQWKFWHLHFSSKQGWGFTASQQEDEPALQFHFRIHLLGSLLAPTILSRVLWETDLEVKISMKSFLGSDLSAYTYKGVKAVTLGRRRCWALLQLQQRNRSILHGVWPGRASQSCTTMRQGAGPLHPIFVHESLDAAAPGTMLWTWAGWLSSAGSSFQGGTQWRALTTDPQPTNTLSCGEDDRVCLDITAATTTPFSPLLICLPPFIHWFSQGLYSQAFSSLACLSLGGWGCRECCIYFLLQMLCPVLRSPWFLPTGLSFCLYRASLNFPPVCITSPTSRFAPQVLYLYNTCACLVSPHGSYVVDPGFCPSVPSPNITTCLEVDMS